MRSTGESLREYGRGVAGGLLFSLPLLYTMEVWQAGFTMPPHRQLIYVLLALVLLLGYNRYAGLHPDAPGQRSRSTRSRRWASASCFGRSVLLLIGRIDAGQDLGEVVGKIVVEAVTVAIGVSVGTAQLGGDDEARRSRHGGQGATWRFVGQLVLALCGAVLFAANVAPTEEIVADRDRAVGLQLAGLGLATMVAGRADPLLQRLPRRASTGSERTASAACFGAP